MNGRLKKYVVPLKLIVKQYKWKLPYPFAKLLLMLFSRSLRWTWIKLHSENRPIEVSVLGNRMILDLSRCGFDIGDESIEKQLTMDHIREPRATEVFLRLINQGDTMLDIGANVGYYALMAAKLAGESGRVIAIEPSRETLNILRQNMVLNGYESRMELHEMAVSSDVGTCTFFVSGKSNLCTTASNKYVTEKQISYTEKRDVKCTTVDDFLKDRPLPSLIKMDIEGAEVNVVKGMQKTLATARKMNLFIEIHPHLVDDTQKMVDMLNNLEKHGFQTHAVISHDDYYRNAIKLTRVEHMTIQQLARDERVVHGTTAFEVFFTKELTSSSAPQMNS